MLKNTELKNYVHRRDMAQKHIVMLCMACDEKTLKKTSEIKALLLQAGLRKAKGWNVAAIMQSSSHLAFNVNGTWELTDAGCKEIVQRFDINDDVKAEVAVVGTALEEMLDVLTNTDTKAFVEEALECVLGGQKRAAVVLSWVGAMHLLYDYVFTNKLSEFNTEAYRQNNKWKDVKDVEDFTKMKEFDFLQIAHGISIFDKSTKNELEARLKFRNACGHPSAMQFTEFSVTHHIDILVSNVFKKFS